MENSYIAPSELIINSDGSIFHLHIKPEQLADNIILVGDPARVSLVASHFSTIEFDTQNREFHIITGSYLEKRITVISTGIGIGNIDIVMNEIDALANIDFKTRCPHEKLRQLQIVRIGTCGGLQPSTPTGSYICSAKSIGLDGLINFYGNRNKISDGELEKSFLNHLGWDKGVGCQTPYAVASDVELVERIAQEDMKRGITLTSCGFFGPQGRKLRIPLADPLQNEKIQTFCYNGMKILNYEMESSAVEGLALLLGHKAVTCCLVIADRDNKTTEVNYQSKMNDLIKIVLQRI